MTKECLQTVLTLIPQLTSEEKISVKAALSLLTTTPLPSEISTRATVPSDEAQICYETICRSMVNKGVSCPPWGSFRHLDIYRLFINEQPQIKSYIQKHFGEIKLSQRQRLYYLFGELLVDWVHRNELPLKLGLVFKNLKLIPELVERSFPGYAEQGWLPMILALGNRENSDDE